MLIINGSRAIAREENCSPLSRIIVPWVIAPHPHPIIADPRQLPARITVPKSSPLAITFTHIIYNCSLKQIPLKEYYKWDEENYAYNN